MNEEKKSKGKEYEGKKRSNSKKTFISCAGVVKCYMLIQELHKNHTSHQDTYKAFLNHKSGKNIHHFH